ncbi:MAG: energy transducer TonB [Gemmatimonadota bacterium]|jgi:TonB family protein|nr:MAG: energy transducer TonB [Gemmatimonadota bacterium]
MARNGQPAAEGGVPASANESFKSHYKDWVGFGVIVAVGLHFAFFTLFPNLQAADLSGEMEEIEAIELPPEVHVPPPPEMIARPATPKVAATTVDEDVTIAPTTFESNPVENLAPPPAATGANPEDRPTFIPYDVPPKLLNGGEIQKMLKRDYPPALREARIEGKVVLWIYIDRDGNVLKAQVQQSSGFQAMDKVALHCADAMEFKPAQNRDKKTPVWVQQAITFEVH